MRLAPYNCPASCRVLGDLAEAAAAHPSAQVWAWLVGGQLGRLEGAERIALRFGEKARSLRAAAPLRRARQAHLQPHQHTDRGVEQRPP